MQHRNLFSILNFFQQALLPLSLASHRSLSSFCLAVCNGKFFVLLAALFALNCAAPAVSAMTLAGTAIDNRASVSYFDTDSGLNSMLQSNTVTVIVQPLEALTLTANQNIESPTGAPVYFSHRLSNTGNTPSSYRLEVINSTDDDYDLSNLKLFRDTNGNGIADAGEPEIGVGQTLALGVGESLNLVASGVVPVGTAPDKVAHIRIQAATVLQNVAAFNDDRVVVSGTLSLKINKAVSRQNAAPGEQVTYTLTALNVGNSMPQAVPATVDGAPRDLVLIRDILPANTELVGAQSAGNGTILYHRFGSAEHSYTATLPGDLSQVDAIAYGVNQFAGRTNFQIDFTVRLQTNASGEISNTAQLYYVVPGEVQPRSIDSNTVTVGTPDTLPTIRYYTNDRFQRVATETSVGEDLNVEVNAARCNLDRDAVESLVISITSLKTGDTEEFTAVETGPNTGIFRIWDIHTIAAERSANSNGWVGTTERDILTARAMCNGIEVQTTILVDPFGVVYDSRTNLPIAGAQVTLIDVTGNGNGGQPGQPAIVFDADGVTPAPSQIITGADGRFQFPLVAASTYRLAIVPPATFTFPSKLPPALQPAGRVIDISGSYGGNFQVTIDGGAVQVDIPLDGPLPAGAFLEKTASRRQVEIGDVVDFTVTLRNTSGVLLQSVVLTDRLPAGFRYQSGTARLNAVTINPTGGAGPVLTFDLGDLAIDGEARVTYRVQVGGTAKIGKNTNRAQVSALQGGSATSSNEASATVDVQGGIFDGTGVLIGRVYVDRNDDGMVQEDEPGIPGVRIYVEDGTFAITDEDGKYSIYGLSPRMHNVKVDSSTLPAGLKLSVLTPRHGNNGHTYAADLKVGEMHKANFAARVNSADVYNQLLEVLKARREIAAQQESETSVSLKNPLNPEGPANIINDVRGLPATGYANGHAGNTRDSDTFGGSNNPGLLGGNFQSLQKGIELNDKNSNLPPAPVRTVPAVDMESLLKTLSNDLGFADLKNEDTLSIAQANIRVKGPMGSQFRLKVNGEEIPQSRVGARSSLESKSIEAWEYVGVSLPAGRNHLEVEEIDGFGNARGKSEIHVIAPGDLGRMKVTVPAKVQSADGKSLVTVKVDLTDDKGAKVSSRTPVTLEASVGQWQFADLNETEPGVQVFIEGGHGEFQLKAPLTPATSQIRATSGVLKSEAEIAFVPELRSMLATGAITTKYNFGFKPRGAQELRTQEIFEDEDKSRGALFLKGRVLGKYLMTLRYDSQKQQNDRLFRDIQPDTYYPVYGDSSTRGFDAQSTSKLYVRIDQNKSYVLYGDYMTSGLNPARSLGEYNRSFTGLKLHHETERFSTNFFYSHDSQRQVIDEIRANGTSGPYLLRTTEFVEQSEKVEIIVRDRNQPSVILSVRSMSRFADYAIDGLSDGILFRAPVPSVDENLNPVFIRVTYEVDQGGPKFSVTGVDAQFKLTQKLEVGGALTDDRNPQDPFKMRSLNATYRFAPGTTLVGEWAQTDRLGGKGDARRLEFVHESPRLSTRLFWGRSDAAFDNPAALLTQGRQETNLKATYKLDSNNRLIAEALSSKDNATGGRRTGAQIAVERSLPNNIRVQVGVRHVKETDAPSQTLGIDAEPANFTSLHTKITAQVPRHPEASVFAEYERAVRGSGQVLAVGGHYQFSNRSRVYLRHELISSLSGRYGLNDSQDQNSTLVGMDMDYMKNGRLFNEYRVRGGISGREAEASTGLRNTWNLKPGLRLNTTFERIKDMGGTTVNGTSTAVTGAIEYTADPKLKGMARIEFRNGSNSDSLFGTLGVAYKMSPAFTVLGKGVFNQTKSSSGGGLTAGMTRQNRAIIGLAYRPVKNDRFNGLLKYEYRQDGRPDALGAIKRKAHLLSADLNYQPSRRWTMNMHYAAKVGADDSLGLSSSSVLQLISGRATYILGKRTDFSVLGSSLRGNGMHQLGLGAELGLRLGSRLRLGAGYTMGRFRDNNLLDANELDGGFYVRMGFLFDEQLWEGAAP